MSGVRQAVDRKLKPNHISSNDDHSKKIILRKNCSGWTIRANFFSLFLRLDKARYSSVFSPICSGPPLLCGLGQHGGDDSQPSRGGSTQ